MIKVRNTDFIQKVIKLDGKAWRLTERPYIFPIINNNFKRTLLMAARQTEKSTSLSGILLSKVCLNANRSALYVSPTGKQTGVFSRKKIDEAFEVSPLLRKNFYPGVRGFRIEEKRLKNFSTIYFRSAFHDADSIRGITADDVFKDEIQDMLMDVIPIIDACAQKRKHAQYVSSGTPKTFDNPIHIQFEKSTGSEWHCKCMGCGHYNRLGIDIVLLDKPGLWCVKCQKKLQVADGVWVNARESDVQGFRLPYIILPYEDIDWKDLYYKIRNYDEGQLMNETFGESFDNGSKPLTRDQLIEACHPDRKMDESFPDRLRGYELYAGIDWGEGRSGFTILTIGYFDSSANKFKLIYVKRYTGRDAAPDRVTELITKTINAFGVRVVGADYGFGWQANSNMRGMLPTNCLYVTFNHSYIKKTVAYDEDRETYVTNRTEVMTDLFNGIKAGRVEMYKWQEFEDIGKDYLNISVEYSEALRQTRYVHTQPDDAFHSCLYARLTWMIKTDQVPSTRYRRGEDEEDTKIYTND